MSVENTYTQAKNVIFQHSIRIRLFYICLQLNGLNFNQKDKIGKK